MVSVQAHIRWLVRDTARAYRKAYNCSSREINCGSCEEFAQDLIYRIGRGATGFWFRTEFLVDFRGLRVESRGFRMTPIDHCFVRFNNRFYDSEASNGVRDYRDLPFFKRIAKDLKENVYDVFPEFDLTDSRFLEL